MQTNITDSDLPPFLIIEPSPDGSSVLISTENGKELPGNVFATTIGPGGHKGSWTLPYSQTTQAHSTFMPGFSPALTEEGSVNITSTAGFDTGNLRFNRAYVRAQVGETLNSLDGRLTLQLINAGTLFTHTYVVEVATQAQPGTLRPTNLTLLGNCYSLRAAGAIVETAKPMNLTLRYDQVLPEGTDPRTLDIYYWNGNTKEWQPLGATLSLADDALSAETSLFGTYALMSRPVWQTGFSNLESLSQQNNLKRAGSATDRFLTLNNPAVPGVGVSQIITPTFGLLQWGEINFTATINAPTTTLTVDVLDAQENLLLANVSNGQNLADSIDPSQHPALRLRVNMSASTVITPGAEPAPALRNWQITWQTPRPGLVRAGSAAVALGARITIPIELVEAPATGLSGATIEVAYNPAILQVASCSIPAALATLAVCNATYEQDGANLDAVRFTLLATPTLTSAITLAEISFDAIGWSEGGSAVEVTGLLALDPAKRNLALLSEPGIVTVTNQATGDVNCDGQLDASDVLAILAYEVGQRQASTVCPVDDTTLFWPQCDVNGDRLCDLRDAQQIVQP